jgi:hypothetical protein
VVTLRKAGAVLAIAITLALVVGCNPLRPSEPAFSRQDAIRRATQQAQGSAPELDLRDARIDDVTAELITLAEVDQRQTSQHPSGDGPGRDRRTAVWWVQVTGRFRYEGMRAPGKGSSPLYETNTRTFIYDARTGDPIGGSTGPAHAVTPAATP